MNDALTITPCVTIQCAAIAHSFGDEIADPLGSIEQWCIVQMRVPRCRLQSGVAEQLADHRQGFRPSGGMAGKAVAQIVRRQNIWRKSRRKLSECGPRLGVGVRR